MRLYLAGTVQNLPYISQGLLCTIALNLQVTHGASTVTKFCILLRGSSRRFYADSTVFWARYIYAGTVLPIRVDMKNWGENSVLMQEQLRQFID